jgi:flagellar basal body-associated protein FliL
MNKMILFGGIGAVLLLAGGGGGYAYYTLSYRPGIQAKPVAVLPKPLVFASIPDIVVSVAADNTDPTTSFVQLTLQFATTNPDALNSFAAVQPIIKSQIISLLMSETVKSLSDPAIRATLVQNCLKISNTAVNISGNFTPKAPFTTGYITSFVVQN